MIVAHTSKADLEMPGFIAPCLARSGRVPEGEQWLHEIKFDGYRIQAHVLRRGNRTDVHIYTRSGLDWSDQFAVLAADLKHLPCMSAIIDGEAVSFDADGITTLARLTNELKIHDRTRAQISLMAFDLLYVDRLDLRNFPLVSRRERLSAILSKLKPSSAVSLSEALNGAGVETFAKACEMGLEGIVSKRRDRPYRSGRGHDWIKSKCVTTGFFYVIGFTPSKAAADSVGALVLGALRNGEPDYAGRVGTGFSAVEAGAMWHGLATLKDVAPSFAGKLTRAERADVTWITPQLIAEVEHRGLTPDGRVRAASFKRFRLDKTIADL